MQDNDRGVDQAFLRSNIKAAQKKDSYLEERGYLSAGRRASPVASEAVDAGLRVASPSASPSATTTSSEILARPRKTLGRGSSSFSGGNNSSGIKVEDLK